MKGHLDTKFSSLTRVYILLCTHNLHEAQFSGCNINSSSPGGLLGAVPQSYQVPMYQSSQASESYFPVQYNKNSSTNSHNQGSRREGFGQNKVECQICGKPNHTALYCYHRQNLQYQPQSWNGNSRPRRNGNTGQPWNASNQTHNPPWNGSNPAFSQSWNGFNQPSTYAPVLVAPNTPANNLAVMPVQHIPIQNLSLQRSNTGGHSFATSQPQANMVSSKGSYVISSSVPLTYSVQGGSSIQGGSSLLSTLNPITTSGLSYYRTSHKCLS